MEIFSNQIYNFLFETIFGEIFLTIVGVALAQPVINWFNKQRYGGWHLSVVKNAKNQIDGIPISWKKMQQVLEIPEEMPVFLKGMCSPYHHINCNLMEEGKECGVLNIDEKNRKIRIDLDKDKKNIKPPQYFFSQKVTVNEMTTPDGKPVLRLKAVKNSEEEMSQKEIFISEQIKLVKNGKDIDILLSPHHEWTTSKMEANIF